MTLQRTWDGGYLYHNDAGGISVTAPRQKGSEGPAWFSYDNVNAALFGGLPSVVSTVGDLLSEIPGVSFAVKTIGRSISGVGIAVDLYDRNADVSGLSATDYVAVGGGAFAAVVTGALVGGPPGALVGGVVGFGTSTVLDYWGSFAIDPMPRNSMNPPPPWESESGALRGHAPGSEQSALDVLGDQGGWAFYAELAARHAGYPAYPTDIKDGVKELSDIVIGPLFGHRHRFDENGEYHALEDADDLEGMSSREVGRLNGYIRDAQSNGYSNPQIAKGILEGYDLNGPETVIDFSGNSNSGANRNAPAAQTVSNNQSDRSGSYGLHCHSPGPRLRDTKAFLAPVGGLKKWAASVNATHS